MEATHGKTKTIYCCAECGRLVEVNARGAIMRSCEHFESGVVASLFATTHGSGSMLNKDAARQ